MPALVSIEDKVISLLGNPEKLMRKFCLQIAGGAGAAPGNGQATVATFQVSDAKKTAKGFTTGASGAFNVKKDRPVVRITKLPGVAKVSPGPNEFNAYYIPMVQTSDVAKGASHYTLPTNPDALDLVITSKLSGCTFGIGSDARGAVLVSHVQPDLNLQDTARAQDLASKVESGFDGVLGDPTLLGKGTGYDECASVIGRRTGAKWTFYLQAMTAKDSQNVVTGVVIVD